MNKLRSFDRQ